MMDAQEDNSCLLQMPVLVLEKILSNIHNPLIVSLTCKYLYEIVCGMDKARRLMYIAASDGKSPLNIDADAVFDSVMNSQRTIEEIELRVGRSLECTAVNSYELNSRQLERMTVIMKQFGANVRSLKLQGFVLSINFIVELLRQAPKLESISFTRGEVMVSVSENSTRSLESPSLKALEIDNFRGILGIVNLLPAGSLTSYSGVLYGNDQTKEVLPTILTKQHTIKSLTIHVYRNSDLTPLRVYHLQLESLTFDAYAVDMNNQFMNILKYHTNLRELRFINYCCTLSGSLFEWICNNLKKLEVFQVRGVRSTEGNPFEMLGELKQLRHFRTSDANYMFVNGFQSSQFKSDSIQKLEFGSLPEFHCGELLSKVVHSMAHNLPNLTHLQMKFENFSALGFVLRHCTQITHLSSYIRYPIPDQLTDQRYPNIKSLILSEHTSISYETLSQSMISIACAMPNLKSVSLSLKIECEKFDVKMMMGFISQIKSLEYFYIDQFAIHPELYANDVLETIRCLVHELKGYHINCGASKSPIGLNWHKIKEVLSNEFYVRDENRNMPSFYVHKGEEKKYRTQF